MTLFEFNLLDSNDKKAEAVWEHGIYLTSRKSPFVTEVDILLYQLPKFYVEIYYSNNVNKILRLLSFHSVDYLEPYLSSINIESEL